MDPRLARVIDTKLLTYTVEQAAEPAGRVDGGGIPAGPGRGDPGASDRPAVADPTEGAARLARQRPGRLTVGGIRKTAAGTWRASWRSPAGRQESKTFRTKREASAFLAQMTTSTVAGTYVSPHAGRMLFGEHARQWMASWNTEATTTARDASIMRVHVLKQWESWPLAKIDHLAIQTWITGLEPAAVARDRR